MNRIFKGFYGLLIAGALSLALMAGCGGGGGGGGGSSSTSDNNTGDSTYSISGTVADSSSVGISGVTVALSDASTSSTTTDSSGNYTFSGLANGSYTVTPSKTSYTFNPSNKAVTVNGADITGQNFVGSATGGGGGGSTAATGRMPDTNQTTSYTSTFGEDHDYTINPPSYTDNGDGTITDNVTGLVWQKQDDATTRMWADADAYCDASTLGGYSDWRLPSQIELISIVDYGVYNPSINTTFFPGTSSSIYWSSTTDAYPTSYAWYVYFYNGASGSDFTAGSHYVRCVRGGETTQSLTDNGNGTVMDSGTLLTWQQGENSTMTWEAALTYCEGLSLAGSTDWRLPNVKELSSLVDDTRFSPAINTTLFLSAISSYYWSSTTYAYSSTMYAWYVDFLLGKSSYYNKTYSIYVRCVRGGSASDDTGSGTTYSISGTVTDSSNVGISGVTVYLIGTSSTDSTTTDASGNYTFSGLTNGGYTAQPSKTGYSFNPSIRAVTVSGTNFTGQDFVMIVAPITLASGLSNDPDAIAVNSASVYWRDSTSLQKVPISGGTVTTLAAVSGLIMGNGIAVDSTSVYWTEGSSGYVKKVSINGGTVTTLASGLSSPDGIVVDSTNIYWTESSRVKKVSINGGTVTTLASGLNNPNGIAVDSTNVYWTEYSGGYVKKVPINGGTVTTLASGLNGPDGIVIDSTNVYWTEYSGGYVKKVPINGGTVTILASGLNSPCGIAVDSTSVYWRELMPMDVKKVGINGGSVTTIATSFWNGGTAENGIAVDSTSVYWTEPDAVKKISK